MDKQVKISPQTTGYCVLQPDVTLATYTFNDARLMQGLLEHVASWSVRPARIVVVDDGSDEPFCYVPKAGQPEPQGLEILRHPKNLGMLAARTGAVEAASTPYVLNMDSDVRLPDDWLERMLPVLWADSGLGMVSTLCFQQDGLGLGTRYMHANGQFGMKSGRTKFLDGCLWLLRKKAWDAVGGLQGYEHFHLDDHEFCRRLCEGGWRMLSLAQPEARQVRLFSRISAARRLRQWQLTLAAYPHGSIGLHERMRQCLRRSLARSVFFLNKSENAFAYVEMLYLVALFLGSMERMIRDVRLSVSTAGEFGSMLYSYLRYYPAAWALLRDDLGAMGHHLPERPVPNAREWNKMAGYLIAHRRRGAFDWLERGGARDIRAEDDAAVAGLDYSFYDRVPVSTGRPQVQGLPPVAQDGARAPRHPSRGRHDIEAGPPKVLFIVDIPNWALDRKVDNVRARLEGDYRTSKVFNNSLTEAHLDAADAVLLFFWQQFRALHKLRPAFLRNRHKMFGGVCSEWELGGLRREQGLAHLDGGCRAVFCNNEALAAWVRKDVAVPVYLTQNGVDTDYYRPKASDGKGGESRKRGGPLVAGWAGSLTNHGAIRGVNELITPGVELAGNWTLDMAAREQRWRGVEEMRRFYWGINAYICGSVSEGAPNPPLEASACGVPVISTPVGMMPQFIEDGVGGFLVDPDPRVVADRLSRLTDPQLRADMGNAARARAELFGWDRMAQPYRKMLDEYFA